MSPSPHRNGPLDAHPDELALAGWSEGRLFAPERERVEAHLTGCRACRELVAALCHDEPAAAPAPARQRLRLRLRIVAPLLLAAALLIAALLLLRDDAARAPGLELAAAGERGALFTDLRGAPPEGSELFVGLRLDQPAWLRLVAVDDAGSVHEVPLDPDGATTARLSGGAEHSFGPYPRALDAATRVLAFVAIASAERLEWSAVEASEWDGSLDPAALEAMARELDATVRATLAE